MVGGVESSSASDGGAPCDILAVVATESLGTSAVVAAVVDIREPAVLAAHGLVWAGLWKIPEDMNQIYDSGARAIKEIHEESISQVYSGL